MEKEVQMKERLLSNRYNEERLKLQRHHDELLQKVTFLLFFMKCLTRTCVCEIIC